MNFDPDLMLLLREVHYLGGPPFSIRLPDPARILLRSTDESLLRSTATRLETIVSRYNNITKNMKEFEQPLFERKLDKIDEVKIWYKIVNSICTTLLDIYPRWVGFNRIIKYSKSTQNTTRLMAVPTHTKMHRGQQRVHHVVQLIHYTYSDVFAKQ